MSVPMPGAEESLGDLTRTCRGCEGHEDGRYGQTEIQTSYRFCGRRDGDSNGN